MNRPAAGQRPSRLAEPGRGPDSARRQVGEYEEGSRGRFGEGEMGTTACQLNDDFGASRPPPGGTPGFAESGRPAGLPWPGYEDPMDRDPAGGAGLSTDDPAYSESFEGRLHPARLDDWSRTTPEGGGNHSDERIKDEVWARLCSSGVELQELRVEVRQGCVQLQGSVPQRAMKHRIEDIVDGAIGVRDIDNRIRVRRQADREVPAAGYAGQTSADSRLGDAPSRSDSVNDPVGPRSG